MDPRQAVGKQLFSRSFNDATTKFVAAGTIMQTQDGQRYVTLESTSVHATSPEQIPGNGVGVDTPPVSAQAISTGEAGDAGTDVVTQLVSRPTGFTTTTNTSAYIGGRDRETDDQFRSRIQTYVASLSRCTVEALESITFGIRDDATGKQVIFNKVVEDQVDRGNVTLYIDDGAGTAADRAETSPTGIITSMSEPVAGTFQAVTADDVVRPELITYGTVTVGGTAGTPANEGTFPLTAIIDDNTFEYTNGAGVLGDDPTTFTFGPEPVATALGNEEFLQLNHAPIDQGLTVAINSDTRGDLVDGSEVFVNPASGLLFFVPPLDAGEVITATYTYFTNLIALVQRVVDGDPNDRSNFPGIRAAGVLVRVLTPIPRVIDVEASLNILDGFDRTDVIADVRTAIDTYINNAGISADIIRHELIERIMGVSGVFDVDLVEPATNINILDNEIGRTTSASVTVS